MKSMTSIVVVLFTRISFFFLVVLAEREHKVHNIILYPEKHSWCQTTPIQQVVASPGYEPVTIDNNICVGACYSYSIPSTQPAEPGELIGPYCDSCQPIETKCYHVTLHADGKSAADAPKTTQKRVQIIMNCSCMSCDKIHKQDDCEINDQHTLELPSDLFSKKNQQDYQQNRQEVPELLHFKPDKNRIHLNLNVIETATPQNDNKPQQQQKYELNSKLISLLKSIQKTEGDNDDDTKITNDATSENDEFDKTQLKELLKMIEGSENEISDKNLMDFVNFVNLHNSEDLEIDSSRLKQVLTKFQKKQNLLERHREFVGNNDAAIGSTPIHHHLGEELHVNNLGLNGHLIKGPHGSMVLSPDIKVEEKLNIDSDILRPNHDGVVISYENHQQKDRLIN